MQQHSVKYTLLFSAAVCGVCAVFVSAAAVTLADRQDANEVLEKRRNVLQAAGLVKPGEKLAAAEIETAFESVEAVVIDLETGEELPDVDPTAFDQQKAKKDPAASHAPPENLSRIQRVPDRALVYKVKGDAGGVDMLVLPIEGYGLWGTLYGFLALGADTRTIEGITYYSHKETPGLGGEVDNPSWKALWPGRFAYDDDWQPKVEVVKGRAGKPEEDPYRVDGLSGATITSRGVTNMLRFWLGPQGFGPYLEKFREGQT
ncbi:MAG TPA: Na(+)-translocating NADH-quinone reductase subunit C [Thermoanaerobaculia bacterium]|jgi:Na+-transporting NADH:ubiquinone oxidoreductase subunit C